MNKAARSTSKAASLFTILFVIALLAMSAAPALAHHKDDHAQGPQDGSTEDSSKAQGSGSDHDGDADSDSNTAYTEDNDTNDGNTPNNVSDDGDNAHPSGKDRSVEHGGSGNQGKAESDPDDDGRGPDRSNGGPDKPNGSGGVDQADQDGNNGCGNDDDFEDDNEGWCGRKPKPVTPAPVTPVIESKKVCPAGTAKAGQDMRNLKDCDEDEVQGTIELRCPVGSDRAGLPMDELKDCDRDDVLGGVITNPATPEDDDVLGKVIRNAAPEVAAETVEAAPAKVLGGVLPFTGSTGITALLAAAIGLIALGALSLALRARKN